MKHQHIISVDQALCTGCGQCQKDCVRGGVFEIDNGKAQVVTQDCIKCAHCVAVCPAGAVSISGFADAPEPVTPAMRVDADALLGQLKARRSMRQFTAQPVAPTQIAQIIEAGRYTPTGSNRQDVRYVVLRDRLDQYEAVALARFRRLKRIYDLFSTRFRRLHIDDRFLFKGAPVVIVVKAESTVDGALAASSMELMAQSLGLGVLYSGFFSMLAQSSGTLRRMLHVASGERVVTTLVIGHPAVNYPRTAPKERADIVYD